MMLTRGTVRQQARWAAPDNQERPRLEVPLGVRLKEPLQRPRQHRP